MLNICMGYGENINFAPNFICICLQGVKLHSSATKNSNYLMSNLIINVLLFLHKDEVCEQMYVNLFTFGICTLNLQRPVNVFIFQALSALAWS